MPKKARRSHVPGQPAKRKARRPAGQPSVAPAAPEPVFAEPPIAELPHLGAVGAVDTRPHRRLQLLTQRRSEAQAAVRVVPGQLPTFERAFLVSELRRIVVTAGALLALIVVLAMVLR